MVSDLDENTRAVDLTSELLIRFANGKETLLNRIDNSIHILSGWEMTREPTDKHIHLLTPVYHTHVGLLDRCVELVQMPVQGVDTDRTGVVCMIGGVSGRVDR